MLEAAALGRFPCVPPEHGLVNVTLKVRGGNEVVDAEHHALEMSPKALDGVGCHAVAVRKLLFLVPDDRVTVF